MKKEATEALHNAIRAGQENARRARAAAQAMEAARPKSHKGTGRVPAKLRGAPTPKAEVVVRAEVGVYRKPDGSKVKGSRAARRAAGQRGRGGNR